MCRAQYPQRCLQHTEGCPQWPRQAVGAQSDGGDEYRQCG